MKSIRLGLAGCIGALALPVRSQTITDPGFGRHPSYAIATIRPTSFQPQVCGMDFLPNGDMVVVTWKGSSTPMWQSNGGKWGQAYLLEGVDGPDREAIKVTRIADGFKDAMGVVTVGGDIYVGDVDRIVKLTNKDGAGMYQGKQEIGKFPSSSDGWFEYSFGPVLKAGRFYMALAVHVDGSGSNVTQKSADRSTVISFPQEGGAYRVEASGFRAPDGIGFGPEEEIFVTDNQGGWLPTNKIIHVVPGRFYGYNATPASRFQNLPMTQPTLWLPYRDAISHSPTELHAMPAGPFKGHMIFGDVSRGGLYRAFLEKVLDPVTKQPEYQGSVFPFVGGLEAGIHRLKIKANGDMYVGGLGNGESTNKGWKGTRFGLQKITAIPGATAFEMLAVRSRKGGMEIEFTKPVGASAEAAANYTAKQWNYIPAAPYGAGKQPTETLTLGAVLVSQDRKSVFLPLAALKDKGFVVHLAARNLKSQDGDTLLYKETWYTLRAMSQAAPFTPPVGIAPAWKRMDPGAVRAFRKDGGGLQVVLPSDGDYRVELADIQGRTLAVATGSGREVAFKAADLRPGVSILKVAGQGRYLTRPLFY